MRLKFLELSQLPTRKNVQSCGVKFPHYEVRELKIPMSRWTLLLKATLIVLLVISFGGVASAEEPSVGILRVYSFAGPKQVAPSSVFIVTLDVEYAVHGPENATIRGAIYEGNADFGSAVWQSEPEIVNGGGDKVWSINLTAPQTERSITLVAFAYYLDQGSWKYYNNSINGPSFRQLTIKIATTASLEVGLGAPSLEFSIDDMSLKTGADGDAHTRLPVGTTHVVSVPPIVEFQNSTRIVFTGWSDGNNQTRRNVVLNGDVELHGSYRIQYALHVNSVMSSYTEWHDVKSDVILESPRSVPLNWPLGFLGLKYNFEGWSGDISSKESEINLTLSRPVTVTANYSFDYTYLVMPGILAVGVLVGVLLAVRHRRGRTKVTAESSAEASSLQCPHCGEAIEGGWAHCIKCGGALVAQGSHGQ